MQYLTVLYDAECNLCQRCRRWLGQQPAYIPLRFLPLQTAVAQCQFPGIERFQPARRLVCVSDSGDVYIGDGAWIICLYALREYREWSARLARPALRPYARRICDLVSQHRLSLSRWTCSGWLSGANDRDLIAALDRAPGAAKESCSLSPPPLPRS
jgi:predicted DCC family thiol-disulfide oxidoreductase YuxK